MGGGTRPPELKMVAEREHHTESTQQDLCAASEGDLPVYTRPFGGAASTGVCRRRTQSEERSEVAMSGRSQVAASRERPFISRVMAAQQQSVRQTEILHETAKKQVEITSGYFEKHTGIGISSSPHSDNHGACSRPRVRGIYQLPARL